MSHSDMPSTESLQDTFHRLLPLWHDTIAPAVQSGQKVLVVAHGNSIRVRTSMLNVPYACTTSIWPTSTEQLLFMPNIH